ncbi:MAG: hypothetical protein K0R43_1976 [Pseudoduganella sp.]|jgi:hypothetical protein|nr:hypothetical protein [Pseudoduganella sp.]
MGLEVEAAGDLLTAGLVAKEVEGDAGRAGGHAHGQACANCGTPVAGNYCGHCGQKGHLHKSVLHLGEELIHGLLHFDTKGWRTLPLLVARPGELTRRYIDGQRTRFVSPLALFLFMMFFMFFVFSLTMTSEDGKAVTTGPEAKAKYVEGHKDKVQHAREVLAEAEGRLKEAEQESASIEPARKAVEKARAKLAKREADLKAAEAEAAAQATPAAKPAAPVVKKADDAESAIKLIASESGIELDGKTKNFSDIAWIDKGIKHAVDNPDLAMYKLKNAAYKYSFLLVPISMPFLWMMFFWRRGISMYDHAVFSLYSLSFMALLFTCVATLGYFGFEGWAASLFAFVPPVHMFLQLRGTYALSRFGAFWRTCFLLLIAFIVLSMYALVVLALSAA